MKRTKRNIFTKLVLITILSFSGCSKGKIDESNKIPDDTNNPSGDVITHTVTFDTKGGSFITPQVVAHGEKIKKPDDPERQYFDFVKWTYNNEDWSFIGYVVTEDMTLDANYVAKEYTATFKNDDGTVLKTYYGLHGNDTITFNGPIPEKSNPEQRYVYSFAGWDKDLVITGDMEFIAQYAIRDKYFHYFFLNYDGSLFWEWWDDRSDYIYWNHPTRPNTESQQFGFVKWEKQSEGNEIVYKAVFDCTDINLTINNGVVTYCNKNAKNVVISPTWCGITVTSIGQRAFEECKSLETIEFCDSLTTISSYAFYNCIMLNNLHFNGGLETIGDYAFANCYSLESIKLPDSALSLGYRPFSGCKSLKILELPRMDCVLAALFGTYKTYDDSYSDDFIENSKGNIPKSLETVILNGGNVVDSAFDCSAKQFKNIILGDSISSIGNLAFGNIVVDYLKLPSSLTTVSDEWLSGNIRCYSIYIPETVTEIKETYISGSLHLGLIVNKSKIDIRSTFEKGTDCFNTEAFAVINDENSYRIYHYSDFVILEIENEKVLIEYIGETTDLIQVPNFITYIHSFAFGGKFPHASSAPLFKIEFGSNIWGFGQYCFFYSKLREITVPESVRYIGKGAFCSSSLKSIVIPQSVTTLGTTRMFESATSLENVTLLCPGEIGERFFYYCSNLKYIVLAKTITSIAGEAFKNCTNFESLYFMGDTNDWSKVNVTYSGNFYQKNIYYYSENQPTESGNFWHWIDGVPQKWK